MSLKSDIGWAMVVIFLFGFFISIGILGRMDIERLDTPNVIIEGVIKNIDFRNEHTALSNRAYTIVYFEEGMVVTLYGHHILTIGAYYTLYVHVEHDNPKWIPTLIKYDLGGRN